MFSTRLSFVLALVFALVALSFVVAQGQQPPVWPAQWSGNFKESTKVPLIGVHNTTGQFYYDATRGFTRVDRENGRYDRYCGTAHLLKDTPCSHIVVDGLRYLYFPKLNDCCMCCQAKDGCGITRRDWLVNATFVGYNDVAGVGKMAVWDKKGLQHNYYWTTADDRQLPYIIDQQPNDIMKYDLDTIQMKVPEDKYVIPQQCTPQKHCGLSVCTIANKHH